MYPGTEAHAWRYTGIIISRVQVHVPGTRVPGYPVPEDKSCTGMYLGTGNPGYPGTPGTRAGTGAKCAAYRKSLDAFTTQQCAILQIAVW
eukprot:1866136-Rhodomonas_salina.2